MGIGYKTFSSLHIVSLIFGFFICLVILYWVFYYIRRKLYGNQRALADQTLKVLSTMLEVRDRYTAHHSSNVADYSVAVAKSMGLSEEECNAIFTGCILHDIGKIYVPDEILLKNGKLTETEYDIIKQHPLKGHQIIVRFQEFKNSAILDIVLHHHERYDGNGYPLGLCGDEIPLVARIVSICDAYDAMTSTRSYRKAISRNRAISIIRENIGSQFDPEVADHFIKCIRNYEEKTEIAIEPLSLTEKTS